MRFDSVDPLLVLGTVDKFKYLREDEDRGFLDKIFHKNKKSAIPTYETAIEEAGRDVLEKEILDDDYILLYTLDKDRTDLYVVLTENYLILPNQDVIPFEEVTRYGLFNELEVPFAQYAEDRMGIPFDPTFISEYEGEETYELDRFSMLFSYVDQHGLVYKYTIYMDVADRQEFYDYLSARLEGKDDYTSKLVINGEFEDNPYENPYYQFIG